MDMSLEIQDLEALFRLNSDAVLGVEDGVVRFANPAAQTLLGAEPGQPAANVLPDTVLGECAESFVASAEIHGIAREIRCQRMGALAVFTLPCRVSAPGTDERLDAVLAVMGENLFTDRLLLDRIAKRIGSQDDIPLRDSVSMLYRSYYRLKRLHAHLQLQTSMQRGELRTEQQLLDLTELAAGVCDTVDRLLRGTARSVRFSAETTEAIIRGDKRLVETMLLNLLTNSLLHTAEGSISVRVSLQGNGVVLSIDDPGSGMDAEKLRDLFSGEDDPKLNEPEAGAGLGIDIVRGIAEIHGGSVLVESRVGEGTRLRVCFSRPTIGEHVTLRSPVTDYRADGLDHVLTELSVFLDKSIYTQKYFD